MSESDKYSLCYLDDFAGADMVNTTDNYSILLKNIIQFSGYLGCCCYNDHGSYHRYHGSYHRHACINIGVGSIVVE